MHPSAPPPSDPVKGKNSHKAAYIAGGVVASVGAITLAVIVALLLFRRYNKVCYKVKQSRFPFTTDHKLTSSSKHSYISSNLGLDTKNERSDQKDNQNAAILDLSAFPNFQQGRGQSISKQFLTDGHERTVHFNYKVTLYGYDPEVNGQKETASCNDEIEEMFMI